MNRLKAVLLLVLCAFEAFAMRTNVVRTSTSNLGDASSYEGGVLPDAGDLVLIPNNVHVTLKDDDAKSVGLVNGLKGIAFEQTDTRLIVEVGGVAESPRELVLSCPITGRLVGGGMGRGKIVKRGAGRLKLVTSTLDGSGKGVPDSSGNARYDYSYGTSFLVEEGSLCLHPDLANQDHCSYVQDVVISNGAVFFSPSLVTENSNVSRGVLVVSGSLKGAGTLTNANAADRPLEFRGVDEMSVFDGQITGGVRLICKGKLRLTNVNSTYCASMGVQPSGNDCVLELASLGRDGQPSAAGKTTQFSPVGNGTSAGAILRYVGNGETCDKGILYYGTTFTLDGGSHGGLKLTDYISGYNQADGGTGVNPTTMCILNLAGSNTVPCEIACNLRQWYGLPSSKGASDYCTTNTFYVVKSGPGIWTMNCPGTDMAGVFGIEEGVLRFGDIAERGLRCSLGTATVLQRKNTSVRTSANDVSYAYELGVAGKEESGLLEYIGNGRTNSTCVSRPAVLNGIGGFCNSTSNAFRFANVSGGSSGKKTLILDGEGTLESAVYDIADGKGTVGIEKRGSGTWSIGGDLAFSGPVAVTGGKLIIRNDRYYSWYRFSVRENIYYWYSNADDQKGETNPSGTQNGISLTEFGLYDADGVRQNLGLTVCSNFCNLAPGQVAFGDYNEFSDANGERNVGNLFDNKGGSSDACAPNCLLYTPKNSRRVVATDSNSWMKVVMRLKDGSKAIASYDFANRYNSCGRFSNTAGLSPRSWQLEASVDGLRWDVLHEQTTNTTVFPSPSTWIYANRSFTEGGESGAHADGCVLPRQGPVGAHERVDVSSLAVSGGGVVELVGDVRVSSLHLDANSGGLVRGGALAESGILEIVSSAGRPRGELPVTFENVNGLRNANGWTVMINGRVDTHCSIGVNKSGTRLVVLGHGLTIVVR